MYMSVINASIRGEAKRSSSVCLPYMNSNMKGEIDAVEMKGRKWILQSFQYEEKTISQHYTQTRNIEKGGE